MGTDVAERCNLIMVNPAPGTSPHSRPQSAWRFLIGGAFRTGYAVACSLPASGFAVTVNRIEQFVTRQQASARHETQFQADAVQVFEQH